MRTAPPWDEVRVFLAVARAGSLVAAAAVLKVSEATAGRRLRALEERLEARLFERLPNSLVLTPLGERLLAAAAVMEEGAADFARAAAAGSLVPKPVRITATGSVSLFLSRHLDRLLAAAPAARLQLLGTRAPLNLARREAELALRMRRPPETGELTVRRLGAIAFALYASSAQPARYIGLRDDPGSRQGRWLAGVADAVPVEVRLDEVHLRLEAARAGLGAALLPCFLGDAEAGLQRLAPPPGELVEEVFLLVHEDFRRLPAVRGIGEALARLFREEAGRLLGVRGAGPG